MKKRLADISKLTLLSLFLLALSACSSMKSERISPPLSSAILTIKGALFGYPDPILTSEIIDNIPYASAMLKIGKGANGLIILESVSNTQYTWVSKDQVFIVLEEGRIIKTEGLLNNLTSLVRPKSMFKELANNPSDDIDYFLYYSYDEPFLSDLKVSATLAHKGFQQIEILGKTRKLLLLEETITNEQIRWEKKNLFWIDPLDHYVWKSIQHTSPKLPPFILQVTKRPRT